MPRQRKRKDLPNVTATEFRELYGKAKNDAASFETTLPFNYCSLGLVPFEDPVCSKNGDVFDIKYILPFLKKYGFDPVTGEKMSPGDLFPLCFHKNEFGQYQCPILCKELTNVIAIAAIKPSGNVYCLEAIEELNIKANNMKDLLTGQDFTRSDIIIIQDPLHSEKKLVSSFKFIRDKIPVEQLKQLANINQSAVGSHVLKQIEKAEKERTKLNVFTPSTVSSSKVIPQRINAESAALTSTAISATVLVDRDAHEIPKITKKKGYVTLITTLGSLNLEIHCDLIPKASENFITLCSKNYYDGTIFHRVISGFMAQGGDPSGTGRGGQSCWNKPFKDEFSVKLSHNQVGVVSMANHGENTNGSQFFITFNKCTHLDKKHTIFGQVVGGIDVLKRIEIAETDDKDCPKEPIRILKAEVFFDPFLELEEEMEEDRLQKEEKERELQEKWDEKNLSTWYSDPTPKLTENRKGIGKYFGVVPTQAEKLAAMKLAQNEGFVATHAHRLPQNKKEKESNSQLKVKHNIDKEQVEELAESYQIAFRKTSKQKRQREEFSKPNIDFNYEDVPNKRIALIK